METRITRWLNKFFSRRYVGGKKIKYSKVIFVESLTDVPENAGKDIYIVKRDGVAKWVVFQCPNHERNRVEVTLMKTRDPHWNLNLAWKKISLWPSVVITGKCDCHFWLKDNTAYLVDSF